MNQEEIENPLNEATIKMKQSHIREYTNYCEIDGQWFKRSIIHLKNKPKDSED